MVVPGDLPVRLGLCAGGPQLRTVRQGVPLPSSARNFLHRCVADCNTAAAVAPAPLPAAGTHVAGAAAQPGMLGLKLVGLVLPGMQLSMATHLYLLFLLSSAVSCAAGMSQKLFHIWCGQC